eukprot:gnl/MRDRNA2_/MRDRNA2_175317_c0_seq1.p1 gnl/MRDRNA2_/MRDRNA2_175317_c0~~gnl/MRDRNA2_/MRDRNA2_175317_c0_seq1.p1  ORF type:complete len:229 (-),score=49.68 gnl/MRDRNA2_/MRDRNA2_175317_c0_seq1:31-717(-)
MGTTFTSDCKSGCKSNCNQVDAVKYHNETPRSLAEHQIVLSEHHNQTDCCNVPLQMFEHGLKRPRDGLSLDTDLRSLADVDGDGVEVGEVIRAIFMVPPGAESMGVESEGGQLLYREVDHGDQGQSAVEVGLRGDMNRLEEQLDKVLRQVKQHQDELQAPEGRDTQTFIHEKAEMLARSASTLAVECSSSAEKKSAFQNKITDLANAASSLSQELYSLHSDSEKITQV